MDAGTILTYLVAALVPLLVKFWWDRSSGALHRYFARPASPDAKSAGLVSAIWLEPEDAEGRWRHDLEIRNDSEVTIVVTAARLPDGVSRALGAARAGRTILISAYSETEVRPELNVQFVLGDVAWELSEGGTRSMETDEEISARLAKDKRAGARRTIALGAAIAPLLVIAFFAVRDWTRGSLPDDYDYVVTPSTSGPNPLDEGDFAPIEGLDVSLAEAWDAGQIIATYSLQPAHEGTLPDEVAERGTTLWIECIDSDTPAGAPMARDIFGDWTWLRDLTIKVPGQQAPECDS